MNSQKGRELHAEAEHLREGGNIEEALLKIRSAQIAYTNDGDLLGLAEGLASEVLAYRHLGEKTGKREYLEFALRAARLSVGFAEKCNEKEALAIPYHTLGKILEDLENWTEAKEAQAKAVTLMGSNPPKSHNRPAYINEMRIHWLADRYVCGEKEVISELDKVLAELETDMVEPRFNRDVWLSGGYMSKAKILESDNPEEAKKAFAKAGEIIKSNPDLKLRREQWDRIAKGLKS